MDARPDPLLRLLVGLTVLMGATIVGTAWLVLAPPAAAPAAPAAAPLPPGACDFTVDDEDTCPAGTWCIRGTCEPRPVETFAGHGESCRERDCQPPYYVCGEDKTCHRADAALPPPPHCEDPQVLAAVEQLSSKCSERQHDISALGEDPLGCSGDVWRDLVASDAEIDLLLGAFPDRFAVSFPRGQPQPRGGFPTPEEDAFLRAQIRPFKARLALAHRIFVIGRASPDGSAAANYALTLRRIDAFERAARRLLQEGVAPSADAPGPTFVSWGVGGDRLLTLPKFVKHYVGDNLPVAFRADEQDRLRAGVAAVRAGEALDPKEVVALEHAINRVVLVIPILCDPRKQTP
jgi:hypothetical protein